MTEFDKWLTGDNTDIMVNGEWKKGFLAHELDPNLCTCKDCGDNYRCRCAFDPYNYDGDCLLMK